MSNDEDRSVNENTALAPQNQSPGFFRELWQQVRLVYKLLLDPEVPIYLKIVPFAALVYLVLPFDFLPDVIPGFGQLDDLTILIVGAKMFIDMAPQQVVARHLQSMRSQGDSLPMSDLDQSVKFAAQDPDVIEGIIIEDDAFEDPVDNDRA